MKFEVATNQFFRYFSDFGAFLPDGLVALPTKYVQRKRLAALAMIKKKILLLRLRIQNTQKKIKVEVQVEDLAPKKSNEKSKAQSKVQ